VVYDRIVARIMTGVMGIAAGIGTFYLVNPVSAALGRSLNLWQTFSLVVFGAAIGGLIGYFAGPPLVSRSVKMLGWIEDRVTGASLLEIALGAAGVIIGLIIANLLRPALSQMPILGSVLPTISILILGYLGFVIARTKKDDVAGIIGSGRMRLVRGGEVHPKLLDTSVIIDGRVADVCEAGFLEGTLIIPSFVLEELRHIADSSDLLRRNRGRRGLDVLSRIQRDLGRPVQVLEEDTADSNLDVDTKLVRLAKSLKASIVTNDYNLNKVASLQGVTVLNVNELATAVRPVVLPGEEMTVHVVKDGKEPGQGVAYLDDGTMIVIDGGKKHVGEDLGVLVTSTFQTTAGRMIFARPKYMDKAAQQG
jgi:uncharacterized protein YacL